MRSVTPPFRTADLHTLGNRGECVALYQAALAALELGTSGVYFGVGADYGL